MNERAFAQSLRRGLGGAILELRNAEDKAAYREVLLRRCLREIVHDWQIEGSRGYYLYDAIQATEEPERYEGPIIERFLSRCTEGLFRQLATILYCFANDGSEPARAALWAKYDYFASKRGRLRNAPPVNEGYQWDEVVRQLMDIDGFAAFKRYTEDAGEILLRRPDNGTVYDVDGWFIACAEMRFGKEKLDGFFDRMRGRSPAIKALEDALKAREDTRERAWKEELTLDGLYRLAREWAVNGPPYKLSKCYRFVRKASEAERAALAQAVLDEEDETVKALLLRAFIHSSSFSPGISPLMEYAQSENALLAESAIDYLRQNEVRDGRLHDLAVRLLEERGLGSQALGLLEANYRRSDDALIARLIQRASTIPHHVQMNIEGIYRRHRSPDAGPILLRVYRLGDCAFCREYVVRAMRHCGCLPDEILEECLYDSYDETRAFAKRIMRNRARREKGVP